MDLRYQHPTEIVTVRVFCNDDPTQEDLVAIGGEHSVEVVQITSFTCKIVARFHIGSRVHSIAWSSRTSPPFSSDDWVIELTAASADFGLHLLTKSSVSNEAIFSFGGGLSGHHGKVNDMAFCGGRGEDSARYVATISDDKMLMVWDLYPELDISSNLPSSIRSTRFTGSSSSLNRAQPTAYVIPFPHPLTAVASHPSSSKEFLVSDCRGSIFLTDWRSGPEDKDQGSWRHSSLVELNEPSALATTLLGHSISWSGSIAWCRDTVDLFGATYGSKFSIWDMSKLQGGKPFVSGISFPEGGHRFRWCHTYPEYFAISTTSPLKGAMIHVHNISYVHSQPTVFTISPRPQFTQDFDFLPSRGIPRIAAVIGRELLIFSIGVDS